MVGGCKGVDGDFRVLTPLGDWDPALATVQHLYGDESPITPPANKPSKTPSQRCTLGDEEWDDMVPLLVARGFLEPRHIKRRESGYEFTADNKGMDCPCCDNVHDRWVITWFYTYTHPHSIQLCLPGRKWEIERYRFHLPSSS